jgi:G:T/U-mismatch repair DNA glycosylase
MKNTTPVQNLPIESHPLEPFLPRNAKILMLGSFPPPKARWSMEWFYPNWINDMWRIMGHIFFNDKNHFEIKGEK